MVKRANTQPAAKAAGKKAKVTVDPVLASIADEIMQAEDIPDRCRSMLVAALPFCLNVPADERHEIQAAAVDMLQQTLSTKKSFMESSVATEELKLQTLQASQSELANSVTAAEVTLMSQKDTAEAAKLLLADATTAVSASFSTLTERRAEQKSSSAKLEHTQAEKTALESAFEAHFKPMKEGAAGEHFKGLEPLLKNLDVESSLVIALPSVCSKSVEARGSFDNVVLEELEKGLHAKIAALGAAVAAETPTSVACETAAYAAQEEYDAKKDTQKQAAGEFEAAQKEQSERALALTKAQQAVEELQPQMNAVTEVMEQAKQALEAFTVGPLASFTAYSSTDTKTAEAALMGA